MLMKANPDARWDRALALFRNNVNEQSYETWFKPIVFESFDEASHTVVLRVSSNFFVEYLEGNYANLLIKVLRHCFGDNFRLNYRVMTDKEHNLSQEIESDTTEAIEAPKPRTRANQSPTLLDAAQPQELDSRLNPRLTFKNYIEGASNKLSRSVGMNIAEHPNNMQFNPMFIYGPSGSGKTHLVNAIGVRTKQLYPQKRVLYLSAYLFQSQYTNAVVKNSVNDFIAFYQTIDMLIVDDIQEWMTATKTQETFFHVFNHLHRNGRRIILVSDRPPVDLNTMSERLLTRFKSGLVAEIERPNKQLCVDILKAKIRRNGLSIPDDVVMFIAENANGNVRDLEGTINSLQVHSIVYNCNIDMRLAEIVLKRAVKMDDHPLTVDEIMETVCDHYNVLPKDVNSKSRKADFVRARQVSMYLAQKYTKIPASRIGKLVGNRDHSTVLHSCMQVEKRLKVDTAFSEEIQSIEASFKLKN